MLRRYWDTPFVEMFHTTAHMKNAVSALTDREWPLRSAIERKLVGLSDSIIAANPDERADLIWRQRAPAAKICTVPPGVDLELFVPRDPQACRAALGLAPNERVVLFVGRVDPIKGIDRLLEAVARVERRGVGVTVLFVGGDLDEYGQPTVPLAQVVRESEQLGIADRFRFVGSQPQDRLPLYYGAADVVAVPSRYESFGLVAVEAMACGVPVVASRAGGLTFTVEDGATGFLVPPDDPAELASALLQLLCNRRLRDQFAINARESAQRFAWPAVASAILHVYQRLADGHRANLCCDEEIYA